MALKSFRFDRWVDVMLFLDTEKYQTQIYKDLNISYSHVLEIISMFESKKLLTTQRNGSKSLINLTPKGKEFQKHLIAIKKLVE